MPNTTSHCSFCQASHVEREVQINNKTFALCILCTYDLVKAIAPTDALAYPWKQIRFPDNPLVPYSHPYAANP